MTGPAVDSAVQRLRLDAEAARVSTVLKAAGVDHLLIKGATTERALYQQPTRRPFVDVDVLVAPEQFAKAITALESSGSVRRHPGAGLGELGVHAAELVRRGVFVDLHWEVPGVRVDAPEAWLAWRRHASPLQIGSTSVPAADTAAAIVLVALKGVLDGPTPALHDLKRALGAGAGAWRDAWALSEELGSEGWLIAALRSVEGGDALARRLGFDAAIPFEAELALGGSPPLAFGLARLADTRGVSEKVRLLARELVPTRDGIRYWRPDRSATAWQIALSYAYRPVFLATRLPAALLAYRQAKRSTRGRKNGEG